MRPPRCGIMEGVILFEGAPLDVEGKADIITYLKVKRERDRRKMGKESEK